MNDHFASIVHADRMSEYQQQAESSRLAAAGATKPRAIAVGARALATIAVTIALLAVLLIRGAV